MNSTPPAGNPTIDIGLVPRKKVLVAEDEENIAALVDDWLSEQYEVIVAYNGKTALQKAKWSQPDVILMDIMMPDMGGFEVVRALQSDPQTRHISVIAMTAKAFDDSTVKLIKGEANVMGFINKPFKRDALRAKLDQVLAGQRLLEAEDESLDLTLPGGAAPGASGAPARSAPPAAAADPALRPEAPAFAVAVGPAASKPEPARSGDVPAAARTPVRAEPRGGGTLTLLGAALLAALAAAETAARWAEPPGARPPLEAPRWPELPYELRAGAEWRADGLAYSLNAWGLRGRPVNLTKGPGEMRVYVLGGASVFGAGVPAGRTAVERLEALLNRDAAEGGGYETVNGGLWGFTPAEQWAHFRRAGTQFRPDALVWLTSPTDPAPHDRARLARWMALPAALRGALEAAGLGRLFLKRWTRADSGRQAGSGAADGDPALREEAARFAAAENVRLLAWSLADPALGLDESLFAADGTLNAAGHKFIAEALAQKLREGPKS